MLRKYYITALWTLFLLSNTVFAQSQALFTLQENQTYVVHFQQGNQHQQSISNYMIRELARANGKRLERTEYSFSYRTDIQVTRRGNRLVTNVEMRNFRLRGDTRYRGFDMDEHLLPDQVQFKGILKYDNKVLKQFTQAPARINAGQNRFTFEFGDTLVTEKISFVMDEVHFIFNARNRTHFNNFIAYVDEYYAADATLNNLYRGLQALNMNIPENIQYNQQQLQLIQSGIAAIQSRDYYQGLRLRENDPIQLTSKLNELMAIFERQAQQLEHVSQNLHIIYYERGVGMLASQPGKALEYFQAALEANPSFAPPMLEMARYFHRQGYQRETIEWLQHAYQLEYIDRNTQQGLAGIAQSVDQQLYQEARDLEGRNRPNEALQVWEQAADFCQSIPILPCRPQITEGIIRAHHSIYSQMVERARQELGRGRITEAENQAQQAIQYQRAQSRYLGASADAQAILVEAKTVQHKNLIEEGRRDLNQQRFAPALSNFESALRMEQEFGIRPDTRLPGFLRQARRPLMLNELQQARNLVQSNELPQARAMVQKIISDAAHYQLDKDTEIVRQIDLLRGQIRSQHCSNMENQLENLMQDANRHIMQGNYLLAEQTFKRIEQLHNQNRECELDLLPATRRQAEVQPAITYQQMLEHALEAIQRKQYMAAVNHYEQAGHMFSHHGLEKFRISHHPLSVFCRGHHPAFILFVAGHYANNKNAPKALELLHALDQLNFKPKDMRQVQEQVGRLLAVEDAGYNPRWNPKHQVSEYTLDKKSMKYLRSAYIKQFKRSRK